jgi:hypothetical protein
MRLTFTLLLILLFSSLTYAQLQKGDRVVTLINTPLPVQFGTGTTEPNLAIIAMGLDGNYGALAIYPSYGFAVHDRLVIGAATITGTSFSTSGGIGVSPYLRYYLVNRTQLGIYGQVASNLLYDGDEIKAFDRMEAGVGLQLPLMDNVRFGPLLQYVAGPGRNFIHAAARIEFVLGKNTRSEERSVAGFGRGSMMFGGQLMSLSLRDDYASGEIEVGGSYFLTDRWALGLSLGVGATRYSFGELAGSRFSFQSSNYLVSVAPRYYLASGKHIVWFVDASVGYQGQSIRFFNSSGESRMSSDAIFATVGGGAQIFVRDNLALEMGPRLLRNWRDGRPETSIALGLGVRFFLY